MSESDDIVRNLGYRFLEPVSTGLEAYHQMEVNIRPGPTGEHFDPVTLDASIKSDRPAGDEEKIENISLYHPWPGQERYQLVFGRLYLKDHQGKTIEAFCFGGEMTVESLPDHTRCRIRSQVPIISLEKPDGLAALFISELEVMLAEDRAAAHGRPDRLEAALLAASPLEIYAASMQSLERRLATFAHKELPDYQRLLQIVQNEIHRLQQEKKWPEGVKNLETLLLV